MKLFLSRLFRNPDEDMSLRLRMLSLVVPLILGFLATLLLIAAIAVKEIFGGASPVTLHITRLVNLLMYMLALSILPSFLVLKVLHLYVSVRLKTSRKS